MNKIFSILSQLLILILINKIGYLVVDWLRLSIPGNVVGMLILFLLLVTGIIKVKWVEAATSILIKHLAFFFIPISVGIITLGPLLVENGIAILVVLILSTFIGLVFSGVSTQILIKKKEGANVDARDHTI